MYVVNTTKRSYEINKIIDVINAENDGRINKLENTYRATIDKVIEQTAIELNKLKSRIKKRPYLKSFLKAESLGVKLYLGNWASHLGYPNTRSAARHLNKLEEFGIIKCIRGSKVNVILNPIFLQFFSKRETGHLDEIDGLFHGLLVEEFTKLALETEKFESLKNQSDKNYKRTTCLTIYISKKIKNLLPTIVDRINTAPVKTTSQLQNTRGITEINLDSSKKERTEAAPSAREQKLHKRAMELWNFAFDSLYSPNNPKITSPYEFIAETQKQFAYLFFKRELAKFADSRIDAEFYNHKIRIKKFARYIIRKPNRFAQLPTTFFSESTKFGYRTTQIWQEKDAATKVFNQVRNKLFALASEFQTTFLNPIIPLETKQFKAESIIKKSESLLNYHRKSLTPKQAETIKYEFLTTVNKITYERQAS
ncbi:MAG: hypothetical protein R3279_12570 [Putridiphycobacter sp.]|nr:hypothetical protein [Putridiphycobacter sp.]